MAERRPFALGRLAGVGAMVILAGPAFGACPEGSVESPEGCRKAVTEIDFDEAAINGELLGPSLEFVLERPVTRYPCDDLRKPGLVNEWETCLVNYYGNTEVDDVSYEIARKFVDTRACPDDTRDIGVLDEVVRTYSRHPKVEDLSDLRVSALYPKQSWVEPQLPLMCGYNVSQRKWYPPRNFYCDAGACYPQPDTGAKDRVRYVPIPNGKGLMEVQSDDPSVRSIADGGVYGHLRVIPLGNKVWLVTSGGMYGDVYYYGLVIVPDEAQYLRRACELETRSTQVGVLGRGGLRATAQRYLRQAAALVEFSRLSPKLGSVLSTIEAGKVRAEAEEQVAILDGSRRGKRVDHAACVLYEARYPRAYQRDRQAWLQARPEANPSFLSRLLGGS